MYQAMLPLRTRQFAATLRAVSESINQLDPAAVRHQARRRAHAPADATYVQARSADLLSERLDWLALDPARVLDTSADGALAANRVLQRYRRARILRAGSADYGQALRRWWQPRREQRLGTTLERVDLADGSIDLAIANLNLPFIDAPDAFLADVQRVLAPNAPLLLAAPGPDTFRELRELWAAMGLTHQVPVFADMHDLGDALVRAGFVEPVLDVDRLTVEFATPSALWRDLRLAGAGNVLAGRARGLAGRHRFDDAAMALTRHETPVRVSIELVFAHAFAGEPRPATTPAEVAIDALSIGRRRR